MSKLEQKRIDRPYALLHEEEYAATLKIPIAFPRKKLYNVSRTTKKAGRKGATNTPRPYAGE